MGTQATRKRKKTPSITKHLRNLSERPGLLTPYYISLGLTRCLFLLHPTRTLSFFITLLPRLLHLRSVLFRTVR